jgi:hypothetical protein
MLLQWRHDSSYPMCGSFASLAGVLTVRCQEPQIRFAHPGYATASSPHHSATNSAIAVVVRLTDARLTRSS